MHQKSYLETASSCMFVKPHQHGLLKERRLSDVSDTSSSSGTLETANTSFSSLTVGTLNSPVPTSPSVTSAGSTKTQSSSVASRSSASSIRSKYFQRLGLQPFPTGCITKKLDSANACTPRSSSVVVLKDDYGQIDPTMTMKSSPVTAKHNKDKPSAIRFNPKVQVYDIPSFREYSDRIRKQIWMDPLEMQYNIQRNIIEYEAECWYWQHVLEEDQFVPLDDGKETKYFHPIHILLYQQQQQQQHYYLQQQQQQYNHYHSQRQRFLMVMSAQRNQESQYRNHYHQIQGRRSFAPV